EYRILIMESAFLLLSLFYSAIIIYFFAGIIRIRKQQSGRQYRVSVLVPARDEEAHIADCLQSLKQQTYPQELYEVFVIDDHSVDATAAAALKAMSGQPNFRLLQHRNSDEKPTFKKQALKYGLQFASGEIIMTIDADSIAQPQWIEKMAASYGEDTGMVAGLVSFLPEKEKSIFHKLQTLEFAGIVFCGAGSLGNGRPIICNGSNLSFRRSAFDEVGGYDSNLHLPSGDDDLLLQNIHYHSRWKVRYALDSASINYTLPVKNYAAFLNQRSRWASKSLHYPSGWIFPILAAIYLFYVLLMLLPVFILAGLFSWKIYIAGWLLKCIPEALLIYRCLTILKRKDLLPWFGVAQLWQVPYIIFAGWRGFFQKYTWKDEKNNRRTQTAGNQARQTENT
ncbi:MAG: glycosyltransferase, partial [Calditrichia bacterium]